MSAVTLETLRADFEAARSTFLAAMCNEGQTVERILADDTTRDRLTVEGAAIYFREEEWCDWPDGWSKLAQNLALTANLYDIARKDGLNAAMLYRLSDGAIDPRVRP